MNSCKSAEKHNDIDLPKKNFESKWTPRKHLKMKTLLSLLALTVTVVKNKIQGKNLCRVKNNIRIL